MRKIDALNGYQRQLVENHMDVVKWTIRKYIQVNERYIGFGFDDLCQEGCIFLIKAAATYHGEKSSFPTYAQTVVKNGLLSYCKKMYRVNKWFDYCSGGDDYGISADELESGDTIDSMLLLMDATRLFESVKHEYGGVALLGIEAMELKAKGYSGADIAAMHGVSHRHVSAWISRAKQNLLKNERFTKGLMLLYENDITHYFKMTG